MRRSADATLISNWKLRGGKWVELALRASCAAARGGVFALVDDVMWYAQAVSEQKC
jgi:hypothetical protein